MSDLFTKNVFINCPFDEKYRVLLKPLLFTIKYCSLNPRIASERMDSSEVRIDKIQAIIEACKYSIHDLSRIKATEKGEFYRLNIALEIGIDMGCKLYNPDPKYKTKQSLILEGEKFSYQKALSDLSGSDVRCHHDDPEELVEEVRAWLASFVEWDLPGPNTIWYEYNAFNMDLFSEFTANGFKQDQIEQLNMPEYLRYLNQWIDLKRI
ncbi:MAG: hypothetical protein RIR11_968 [Bacteroidota bacterium]|jgi:hypothetical protein